MNSFASPPVRIAGIRWIQNLRKDEASSMTIVEIRFALIQELVRAYPNESIDTIIDRVEKLVNFIYRNT